MVNFLYDGDRLVGEYDAAGTLLRRYVFGSGVDRPVVYANEFCNACCDIAVPAG